MKLDSKLLDSNMETQPTLISGSESLSMLQIPGNRKTGGTAALYTSAFLAVIGHCQNQNSRWVFSVK